MTNLMKLMDDAANASVYETWRPISVTSESMALQAALAALDAAGYAIVPKEPTEGMLEAGYIAEDNHQVVSDLYRQMIAAAPKVAA